MRLLIPILAILLLASCRTTKTVTQTRLVTDSTTERALREHARMLEEELRAGGRDSVVRYVTDVVFEECDSAAPATVVFDNGKLASVTGQLRAVRQQLSEEASERYYQSYRADSLQEKLDSIKSTKRVEYVDKVREVKRAYIPLWVWFLIAALAGLLLRVYWPRILDLFIKKRTI